MSFFLDYFIYKMTENGEKCSKKCGSFSKQPKILSSVYIDIKQRKDEKPHISEAGSEQYLTFLKIMFF